MKNQILFLFMFCAVNAFAQGEEEHGAKHHRLALFLGQTHIPASSAGDLKHKEIYLPSFGIDYQYWFGHRVGLGWFNDLGMASYVVVDNDVVDVEREFPFVSVVAAMYRPWKGLSLFGGPGMESGGGETNFVVKLGLEYEVELEKGWDLSPAFNYDIKNGRFGAWSIGLAIGKKL